MTDETVVKDKTAAKSVKKDAVPDEVKAKRRMRIQEFALPVVLLLLFIFGASYGGTSEAFLTESNLLNVLIQASVVGVIAVGMTFVIATGGIDLSVGSLLALAAVFAGRFVESGSWAYMAMCLVAAMAIGAVNGFLVSYARIVPFIATLAMLTVARGLALSESERTPISVANLPILLDVGTGRLLDRIPIPALIFIVVTILGWVLLNRTRYGRYVVAVGGNREAARIAGIKVKQIVFSTYALVGACTGIAAILITGRLASASPVAGIGYELDAIAAVVVGGTSLAGGRASMVGTFFGVLVFALVFNLLNLLNMPLELQQIVKGLIVLAAVVVQRRDS